MIAGGVSGELKQWQVYEYRTFFGGMADPWTSWLLARSMETLHVRGRQPNHQKVLDFFRKTRGSQKWNCPRTFCLRFSSYDKSAIVQKQQKNEVQC